MCDALIKASAYGVKFSFTVITENIKVLITSADRISCFQE